MPNWKKLIVSGSDASLNSLNVTNNVTAQSFTGSFSGSFTAPGATTQIVYNDNGVLAANSGLVYSGSNVGIGISSPTEKLHIVSSATGNQFGRITATDATASAAWVAQNDSGDNVVYRVFSSGVSGTQMGSALGRSASLLANLGGSGVFLLGTFSNTNFVLGTNNTENMRITTAGNVGIGTSSPAYLLDVNGTARVGASGGSGQLYIKGFAGTGQYLYLDDGSKVWSLVGGTDYGIQENGTTRLTVKGGGNVGIGTTSPATKFVVSNAGVSGLEVDPTGGVSSGVLIQAYNRSTSAYMAQSYYALTHTFNVGSGAATRALDITSAGDVGIGNTSPNDKLDVSGNVSANAFNAVGTLARYNGTGGVAIAGLGGSSYAYILAYSDSSGTSKNLALQQNGGNVGIGTTSPTYKLHVSSSNNNDGIAIHYPANNSTVFPFYVGDSSNGIYARLNATEFEFKRNGAASTIKTVGSSNNLTLESSTNLIFNTNGASERMRIDTSGNVGIGTSSPGYRLDVAGYTNTAGFFSRGANIGLETQIAALGTNGAYQAGYYLGATNTVYAARLGMDVNSGDVLISAGNTGSLSTLAYFKANGNIGIGTSSPVYKLEVVGAVSASTYYGDGSNLTNIGSGSVSAAGSDGQLQYNNSGLFGGATRLIYNDSTNRVGIGTSSPGYDLDVSGSARVQDRLRVGVVNTGNGVIHQSSDATINPLSSTIVWSVPGSAGICAFIEYYVFNSNTGTSQRAGNIVTTWNSAGTPQITHTETTTPDIGTTALVTFTTSITLGGDPQLVATNTSGDVWYMVMNYRYF